MVRYYVIPVPSPYTIVLSSYSKIWPIMQLVLALFAFTGVLCTLTRQPRGIWMSFFTPKKPMLLCSHMLQMEAP
jgi:hypothetical protein